MFFQYPQFLWLLLVIPVLSWMYATGRLSRRSAIRYSSTERLRRAPKSRRIALRHSVFALRMAVLALLILAMAGPVSTSEIEDIYASGVDIVLTLDVSGSMQAVDLDRSGRSSRLDVAKAVADDFIEGRRHDRIGLVIFGTDAFTQCPMTLDYNVLKTVLGKIELDRQLGQSTAIGMGLASAVRMLQSGEAKSKVIILLTDGVNNAGDIDPLTAAQLAKALGVRVYTIGVGSEGFATTGPRDILGFFAQQQVQIDEETLKKIAATTGGQYYRVRDKGALAKTFEEIDKLERSEIKSEGYRRYSEKFAGLAFPAVFLLLLEMILANTVYRRLP
ncbi:VWA domain-containing protein [bacterium]|nr:VWA domain-containing protein [bacterium]